MTSVAPESSRRGSTSTLDGSIFDQASPTSPLLLGDQFSGSSVESPTEVSSMDEEKFAAGWECVWHLPDSLRRSEQEPSEIAHPGAMVARQLPMSIANPETSNNVRKLLLKAYETAVHDGTGVRAEIGDEFLRSALRASEALDRNVSTDVVHSRQTLYMDASLGIGEKYLHNRDVRFADILDEPNRNVHTFLPGYATGDRYSLMLSAMIEPRLHISIGYTEGDVREKRFASEAFKFLSDALRVSGEDAPESRISLLSYEGPSLAAARESLDSPETRKCFVNVDGADSPLDNPESQDDHIFHISVTTELIARHFRAEGGISRSDKHEAVRQNLHAMVAPDTQKEIEKLVDGVMKSQGIEKGAVGLWIGDRELPNDREGRAVSRPAMFELIAHQLRLEGRAVYGIADTFINPNSEGQIVNRHPYRPSEKFPHIGRFWAAEVNGVNILAPRENQWFFVDTLLRKTGAPLIAVRSGAVELPAVLGHTVIYLEDVKMFTPERHASWQGVLPYFRLMIGHPVGYEKQNTEIRRAALIDKLLGSELERKLSIPSADNTPEKSKRLQSEIEEIGDDITNGVMSTKELELLVEMVKRADGDELVSRTAMNIASDLWDPTRKNQ